MAEEKIKLAAIKRLSDGIIFTGRNHSEIILTRPKGELKRGKGKQGFITDKNRFVGRAEAGEIAYFAGQINKPTKQLFSEDITGDWPWSKDVIVKLQAENERLKEKITKLKTQMLPNEIEQEVLDATERQKLKEHGIEYKD